MERIDCFKCRYMQVTWDRNFPYGCRAMGFKSKVAPSMEVFRSSGMKCMQFQPKERSKPGNMIPDELGGT
jgi:hypothetical protein